MPRIYISALVLSIAISAPAFLVCMEEQHRQQPPIVINVSPNATASTNTQQTTAVSQSLNFWQYLQFDPKPYATGFFAFLDAHKYKLLMASLAATYAAMYYQLLKDKHFIYKKDTWAAWKQNLSFDQLCELPSQELEKTLLHEIQIRYLDSQNPTNFISPLVSFVNSAQEEQHRIKRYLTYADWLKKFYLSKFFPLDQQTYLLAQDRLNRLAFVKHIFSSWAASFNMSQAQQGHEFTSPTLAPAPAA
jgi:hypothetical protein